MQSAKRVGSLAFDPVEGIIWRNGVRIPLTPKAAAILSYLVDRPGRIVPLGQILEAVWPGTFVQPEGIKVYIFELRRALGDNAKNPAHIESIQRRGYRLIGPLADLRDRRPSIEISRDAQLPGRRVEFEILDECLGKARDGAMQIIFLDGESGIGKTTLVEAFAASRESEVQVVSGRCIPTQGGQEPYYPVLEALGKVESEDFPRILALHAPTWAMQMPAKFSEQERAALRWQTLNVAPARMLRELCELIEAISQTSLLLFILEDLHWADPATLDFVNTMARRQHARKLLLIGTSLPAGGISAGHPLRTISRELFVKSLCRHIELSPLTPAAVSSILVQELGASDVSEQLVNNVVESSGGNPLFIRSIIERIKEGYGPSRPAGSMDVSEDLKQVILDQFSDLTSEERLLLEYGSVAGASFSGWLIAPLLDSTPDATDARYEAMAESRRFIRIAADGAAAGALAFPRFEFIHGPARHLIYGHVGRARKNEIHRAMAARLESAQDDANTNAAELAWHYEEYGELRKSGRYLRIAAQQAIERYELHDAIMLVAKAKEFEGALQRPEAEVESAPRIRSRWSEAFPSGMDFSVTVEDWERILAAFLSERWGHVARATSEVLGPMGSFRRDLSFRAVEFASPDMTGPSQPGETAPADVNTAYRRLLAARWKAEEVEMVRSAVSELCAHDPDHSLMVGAHLEAARLLVTSDYDASWRLARIARETAWRQQDAVGLRSSGRLFRCALFYAGRWRELLQEGSASLEESEKIGDPASRDVSLLQLAHLHAACFDFEGALALCAKISSLAKSDKRMVETIAALEAVALAGLAKLDPTAANPILLPNAGDVHRSAQWAMEWAAVETLLDRNAVDEALPRAEVMLQFILATEERSLQAITWEQMARLHLLRGDAPLATQSIRYALSLVERSDLPVAAWRVLHVAAAIARQSGDKDSNAYRKRAKEATKRLAGELEYQKDLQKSFLDGTKRYVESVWATL